MASEKIHDITLRYSMLQLVSPSDLKENLTQNIHHTQAIQVQIAHAMSRLEEEHTQ